MMKTFDFGSQLCLRIGLLFALTVLDLVMGRMFALRRTPRVVSRGFQLIRLLLLWPQVAFLGTIEFMFLNYNLKLLQTILDLFYLSPRKQHSVVKVLGLEPPNLTLTMTEQVQDQQVEMEAIQTITGKQKLTKEDVESAPSASKYALLTANIQTWELATTSHD